jgi:hypothetical protein
MNVFYVVGRDRIGIGDWLLVIDWNLLTVSFFYLLNPIGLIVVEFLVLVFHLLSNKVLSERFFLLLALIK